MNGVPVIKGQIDAVIGSNVSRREYIIQLVGRNLGTISESF